MCEATTIIAAAGLGTSLLGGVTSAIGRQQSAAAQSDMYEYQAKLAEQNAEISRAQSEQVLAEAQDQKESLAQKVSTLTAQGRANYAAGNVLLGTGSPADWEESVTAMAAEDETQIDYNTSLKRWAYDNQANQYDAQSSMYNKASDNSNTSGWLDFGSSLLSTVGSTALMGATADWGSLGGGSSASKIKKGAFTYDTTGLL